MGKIKGTNYEIIINNIKCFNTCNNHRKFNQYFKYNWKKTNITTNYIQSKTQQDTIYIDKNDKQITNNEIDLSDIESKKVIQIGFYKNQQGEIQVVRMPEIIEEVPKQLPSEITSLSYIFTRAKSFNQDLSTWDVSNVRIMTGMFADSVLFDQDLSKWDVSNVLDHTHFAVGSAISDSNKLPKFKNFFINNTI
ncbi:BspA family leucine-rich repeat surface protein [Spiroplasma ixodetis]|uniref:BspA family leucine-rich repeat surface protein n=1 Tax=Spiroplasma ixodetis TaxID=2141 RepID=UPI002575D1D2|nr:BspA family leucine-rich repeat surface protein [Spiroplasma ixodetis]WJG70000.1 hypothetical protein SIXOD_v1c10200 [Spiroplasma ixodetis Y32]